MRYRIDCAVFQASGSPQLPLEWFGSHNGGRLYVHSVSGKPEAGADGAILELAQLAMAMRRFDACVVVVNPDNLAWARQALVAAVSRVSVPFIAVTNNLCAGAISDLYRAGIRDFLCQPLCHDELRARIEHLLESSAEAPGHGACVADAPAKYETPVIQSTEAFSEDILLRSGGELDAFAVAAASRSATGKDSFRKMKCLIVSRFEQAFIRASLDRHSGNISLAARASQKHRRAFWGLMQKYNIDPTPFRRGHSQRGASDG